jgi:hypothetical protein
MNPTAVPASELERRKQPRIRLRADLVIDPQKYEGRTCYVVKDPVSLRYYRLKDTAPGAATRSSGPPPGCWRAPRDGRHVNARLGG